MDPGDNRVSGLRGRSHYPKSQWTLARSGADLEMPSARAGESTLSIEPLKV